MRKIVAVFLILAIAVVFASCGKDGNDETPSSTLLTGATISTQVPTTTGVNQSQDANANVTYILTTSPDKTVPWGETTKFSPNQATSNNQTTGIVINITTDSNSTAPSVNYGTAPATTANQYTTKYEGTNADDNNVATTTTSPTSTTSWVTTTKVTTTTAPPTTKKTPVFVELNSHGYSDQSGVITIEISDLGWKSSPNSNSQNLPIYIDGSSIGSVPCSISSKNVGSGYNITIDVSEFNLTSGTYSIDFPEGFIENSLGQYNEEFNVVGDIT